MVMRLVCLPAAARPQITGVANAAGFSVAALPAGEGEVVVAQSNAFSFNAPGITEGYTRYTLGGASSLFTFGSDGGGTKE
jgi:hypothetical protein